MSKRFKRIYPVVMTVVCIVELFLIWRMFIRETHDYSAETVVTWVAHVPNTFSDMELVYADYENDVAYYKYVGDRVTPEVGDILQLYDGTNVAVTSVTNLYFTVKSDDPSAFQTGLSNTPVLLDNGTVVGYISTLMENGQVKCIWR